VPSPTITALDSLQTPRSWTDRTIGYLVLACGLVSVATTAGIVAVLFWEAMGFLREVPLARFLSDTQWTPQFADKHFGIWPLVCGTLLTTVIAVGVAVPIGLLAAIYLAELASPGTRRLFKPALEVLAGQGRGADPRAARAVHHRDSHPQHATSGACFRLHCLSLPGRADRA
jgi:ABC-type phosphate transport system permease subunit